jgi:hypothetical protein
MSEDVGTELARRDAAGVAAVVAGTVAAVVAGTVAAVVAGTVAAVVAGAASEVGTVAEVVAETAASSVEGSAASLSEVDDTAAPSESGWAAFAMPEGNRAIRRAAKAIITKCLHVALLKEPTP